jgi:hypothetical protein
MTINSIITLGIFAAKIVDTTGPEKESEPKPGQWRF